MLKYKLSTENEELRYLRSLTQSDLYKYSTIHIYQHWMYQALFTQLHCILRFLNARMLFCFSHFIWKRNFRFSTALFFFLFLTTSALFSFNRWISFFRIHAIVFNIIHFLFAYCGKSSFIQGEYNTSSNKIFFKKVWEIEREREREKSHGRFNWRISIESRDTCFILYANPTPRHI